VLGLVFALTGDSIAAARVVQSVLGVAAVWMVIDTATRWFDRRAGLVAGALAAATGLVVFNELLILQSSLDPSSRRVRCGPLLARCARHRLAAVP